MGANRFITGNVNTVLLRSTQLKGMSVQLVVTERGMSPKNVTDLMLASHKRYMRKVAQLMVYASRCLAPTSHGDGAYHEGSLTDSIIAQYNPMQGGKYSFTIGVDGNNWNSDYDERYMKHYHREPPWGTLKTSKNNILYILHDHWNYLIQRMENWRQNIYGSILKDLHPGESLSSAIADMKRQGLAVPGTRSGRSRKYTMDEYTAKQRAENKQSMWGSYYTEVLPFISGYKVGEKFLYNGVKAIWDNASKTKEYKHFFEQTMNMSKGLLLSRHGLTGDLAGQVDVYDRAVVADSWVTKARTVRPYHKKSTPEIPGLTR